MDKQGNNKDTLGITVKKEEDTPEWYAQVILKSGMADTAPVSGCMIIRPLGYALWEHIMDWLNARFKIRGVDNTSFPLFIPENFFTREAEHAEGFAPEVAWVEAKEGEERYAVRPTSETIMYDAFGKWIRSWRELPLRINQWCNIVRWEVKDLKMFLRSREFLWQEGHCVYETEEECKKEILLYLDDFKELIETQLALPVFTGKKTDAERFAGAIYTMGLETLMPDGKSLQLGTVHQLSQGFAKSFNISFEAKDGTTQLPWQNSWAVSTRLLGALVLVHSDNKGLVIPPHMARDKGLIIPIYKEENRDSVLDYAREISKALSMPVDDRDSYTPGWKFNEAELKGYPVRIEVGPREKESNTLVVVRRDTGEKQEVTLQEAKEKVPAILTTMQQDMFERAKQKLDAGIEKVHTWDELVQVVKQKKLGMIFFCGKETCEKTLPEGTGIGSRVMSQESATKGTCFQCGEDGILTYFGKAY